MRKLTIAAVLAVSAVAATPAVAGETGDLRAEARTAIAWSGGTEDFLGGIAVGYDHNLGSSAFAGAEVSLDSDFEGNELINVSGRLGAKLSSGKLYGVVGYEANDIEEFNVGAGYEHNFGGNLYGKVEYRRYLLSGTDGNVAGVGIGMRF